jgi:O-acetylserine/cysteine efflux transporter
MTTNRRLVIPALVTAGVLWGTTVPLSKVALGWLPPAWLAFVRFALAAAVLLVVSRTRLRTAFTPAIMVTGAIGYGGSVLLQNLGIERTSVTHAALLIGATPVLVAIAAAMLGHSVARPLAWAGFMVSLVGVGFIAGGQGSGSSLAGDGLVLIAQLISAGFTVSQARLLRGYDPIAVTGLQLLGASVVVLPVALLTEHQLAGSASPVVVLATIGLVVAGTVLPTSLFAFGQSRVAADVAGAFLNLEPLVGAIMGMALFAEPAGAVQLAGGAAISAGIGLSSIQVVRGERRARASSRGGDRLATTALAVPSADSLDDGTCPQAASTASGRSAVVATLRPPGEAPSVVKRTKLPTAARASARRLRRRANSGLRGPGARLRRSRGPSRRRSRMR